jgi:hypothetical protein
MRTKKDGIVPPPTTVEGLTESSVTRLVGEGDEADLRE